MTILHLDNVTLHFAGNNKPTLKQISYKVQQGDFIILLGSNGSGKSSLLKLLHQQYQPDSGQIHFIQQSQRIAVLTQNCTDSLFPTLTLYENYLLTKKYQTFLIRHKQEKNYLAQYLFNFNANLANKLDLPIYQLSGGEKQALALALCLMQQPSLLLLDEHTSALDPKTSEQIMQLTHKMLLQHNITCILTTHDLEIALRYGNRILMLHEGNVLALFDHHEKEKLSKAELINHYYYSS